MILYGHNKQMFVERRGYDVEQDFDFEIGLLQFQWL